MIVCLLRIVAAVFVFGGALSTAHAQEMPGCDSRPKIDTKSLQAKTEGFYASISLGNVVTLEAGDKTLQTMHESVQILNKALIILTEQYNKCLINGEDYLIKTQKAFDDATMRGDKINNIVIDIKKIQDQLKKKDRSEKLEMLKTIKSNSEKLKAELIAYHEEIGQLQYSFEQKLNEDKIKTLEKFNDLKGDVEESKQDILMLQQNLPTITKKVDERVEQLSKEVEELVKNVDELRGDVKFLLHQFYNGHLDTTRLLVDFSPAYTKIGEDTVPSFILALEILYPPAHSILFGSTPIVEFGYLDWSKSDSYSTLPGLAAIPFKQENSMYFIGGGVKKYIDIFYDSSLYFGLTAGYGQENEPDGSRDIYYSGVFGIAAYPSKARVALELRYLNVAVSEKQIQFNPFGEASMTRYKNRNNTLSIGLMLSFLIW